MVGCILQRNPRHDMRTIGWHPLQNWPTHQLSRRGKEDEKCTDGFAPLGTGLPPLSCSVRERVEPISHLKEKNNCLVPTCEVVERCDCFGPEQVHCVDLWRVRQTSGKRSTVSLVTPNNKSRFCPLLSKNGQKSTKGKPRMKLGGLVVRITVQTRGSDNEHGKIGDPPCFW